MSHVVGTPTQLGTHISLEPTLTQHQLRYQTQGNIPVYRHSNRVAQVQHGGFAIKVATKIHSN